MKIDLLGVSQIVVSFQVAEVPVKCQALLQEKYVEKGTITSFDCTNFLNIIIKYFKTKK